MPAIALPPETLLIIESYDNNPGRKTQEMEMLGLITGGVKKSVDMICILYTIYQKLNPGDRP
jgi:hypothetical protein